ncbi:hypothetical protein J437_LFUL017309 [Ladona fulva]|uniref:Uncharacterized protein n=1 Tax=Ladona fulva TaxID=123851 RepID=A0A8K0KPK8_LADFU|nr:hypothetical protein J437_LFUL017309 [Ladona fulva]
MPTTSLRLPKFGLPHFSGDLNGWIYFSNLFDKTINENESLSEIERFQYLLSSLRGEALNIVSYHISNVIDLPNVNGSLKGIRNFLDIFRENTQALIPVGHDITSESFILLTLLLRKLNSETRKQTKITSKRPSKVALLSVEKAACEYCSSPNHNVYKCDSFLNSSAEARRSFARTNGWCFNCLGTSHSIKSCKSTQSCRKCGKRHHSLLHLPHLASASKTEPSKISTSGPSSSNKSGESVYPDTFV